jgi:hypothetical protein
MQHRQQAKIFLSPAGSFVAGKQTVGRAALVGVLSPETIVSQSDLVVTTEGTVGDAATVRVHIQAKQPHLGDVISTEFVLELEGHGRRHYAANLPDSSGASLPPRRRLRSRLSNCARLEAIPSAMLQAATPRGALLRASRVLAPVLRVRVGRSSAGVDGRFGMIDAKWWQPRSMAGIEACACGGEHGGH